VWDTHGEQPETAALFNDYMTETATRRAAAVLHGYDFTGIATLVDAGGGHGRLLSSILHAYPTMRGILFDLPHVIEAAQGLLTSVGVADRCECVGGSFFESVPGGADAYLLSVVIHDWNDERARTILQNCRAAMGTSGRLLLVERVVPASEPSLDVALPDLQMLVGPGGCERTAQELMRCSPPPASDSRGSSRWSFHSTWWKACPRRLSALPAMEKPSIGIRLPTPNPVSAGTVADADSKRRPPSRVQPLKAAPLAPSTASGNEPRRERVVESRTQPRCGRG
jgi:hypothetical protein